MILLDTHTWVWWVMREKSLLPAALEQKIMNNEEVIAISCVSCLETALLFKKGRIKCSEGLDVWFKLAIEGTGIEILPLTPAISAKSVVLPDIHRDPIDRILIATAMEYDAYFATKDSIIQSYPGIKTIWQG